jgi:nitrate/nitrite transporter NarK
MLGIGVTWGVGWGTLMLILGTIIGAVDPDAIDEGEEPWRLALMVGTVGFLSGIAFASIFSWLEHRNSLSELSTGRAALWGAIGGAVLPLLTSMNDAVLFNTMPHGAIFAASTVAIARRATLHDGELVKRLNPDAAAPRPGA